MVRVELTPEQAATLKEILTVYVSELSMEIADTDMKDFRDGLKRKKEFALELIDRL